MSFSERYSSFYRDATTSRGMKYHYLAIAPSQPSKPTLVFIHGFPSSSHDWSSQIVYFHQKGYGLIVPDMLGYGGTDKPADSNEYRLKLLAQDVVDIVAKENPRRAIAIGHDWGSFILSKIVIYHPTVFDACAWFAVSFVKEVPSTRDFTALLSYQKQKFGAELFAYQEFLVKPDAAELSEKNFDSFVDKFFADEPAQWTVLINRGQLTDWITQGTRGKRGHWLTSEYLDSMRKNLLVDGGLNGGLNYYRALHEDVNKDDDEKLQGKDFKFDKPAFFGATKDDLICIPKVHIPAIQSVASNLTVFEFNTSHWVFLEQPDQVNEQLEKWLTTVVG